MHVTVVNMSSSSEPSTPKSTGTKSDIVFSPVKTPVPEYDSRLQGNLTGTLRKVKDSAADVHNQILKWRKLNIDGSNIITEIANIKIEKVFSEEDDAKRQLPESLEPLCEKLTAVYQGLEKIVGKLHQLTSAMTGLQALAHHKQEQDKILFQTWTIHQFVTTLTEICSMYSTEAVLKKSIVENVAHAQDRKTMMFYSAAWIHEPYIDSSHDLLLDSLLVETGHR